MREKRTALAAGPETRDTLDRVRDPSGEHCHETEQRGMWNGDRDVAADRGRRQRVPVLAHAGVALFMRSSAVPKRVEDASARKLLAECDQQRSVASAPSLSHCVHEKAAQRNSNTTG